MSIGKSRLGRQSPYQLGLSAPPRPKNSIIGSSKRHRRVGHADLHDGAGEVAGEERLLAAPRGCPTASMHTSAPLPSVSARIASTGSSAPASTVWVAPNSLRPLELAVVEVDGDDRAARRRGARRRSPRRRRRRSRTPRRVSPRPTLAGVASPRRARPSRRSRAARRPPGSRAGSTFVAWPAATSVFSANAPMPSAGESSVPSVSVIFCVRVVRREAVPGAARAGTTGTRRTPPAS